MSFTVRTRGLDKVLLKLQKELRRGPKATLRGLIRGGLRIRASAQNKVPVDLGNLRASAYTVWGTEGKHAGTRGEFNNEDGDKAQLEREHQLTISEAKIGLSRDPRVPQVQVGFTAFYALFVHEDQNASHPPKDPKIRKVASRRKTGTAKYLEKAIIEEAPGILQIVRQEYNRRR